VRPGARATDIVELVRMVKERVREAHGIDLRTEVVYWSRSSEPHPVMS
jgi:UDP-N-acetylenolpyruvoylglucosamine reductase